MDWSKQHCGVHQASFDTMLALMPDIAEVVKDFPENHHDFTWDVKVHMLMPGQFPCIPNWHYDNVPRVNNKQDFDLVRPDLPMYLYVSGHPLTLFRNGGDEWEIPAGKWYRFTQMDEHRGQESREFCWRGLIRATHKGIMPQNRAGESALRRHSQVYLDASNFKW